MANYLKMANVSAILTLKEHGWSQRRIARELGVLSARLKKNRIL